MVALVNSNKHQKILEIGIGDGIYLHRYYAKVVYGIDQSEPMIKLAKRNNPSNNHLYIMNGENLLFDDGIFDAVVLSHVISVVEDIDVLLMQSARVLKPHGYVYILNHFTPNNPLKWLDKFFSMISKLFHFQSEFSIKEIDEKCNNRLEKNKEIDLAPFSYFKILIYKKV